MTPDGVCVDGVVVILISFVHRFGRSLSSVACMVTLSIWLDSSNITSQALSIE